MPSNQNARIPHSTSDLVAEGPRHGNVDELFERYRDSRDGASRDALIEGFLPLARRIAARYQRPAEPLDDLFQVACVALIKAVDRFEPDRGVTFSSYAVPTMAGELKRYRRDHAWAVHVPRSLQELVLKVEGVVDQLAQRGRSPTPNEVAAHLDIPIEDVLSAMEAGSAFRAASLDAPRRTDDGELRSAGEWIGDEDPRYELVEHDATIAPALKQLARRERLILHLRFVEDMSQSEIARRIGVSQMQVSRLIRQTLSRLREAVSNGRAREAKPSR